MAGLAATGTFAQVQPSHFPGGFPRGGQAGQANPEELSVYQSALAQQNPVERVSALQQFLSTYPTSSMRQPAISALMAAQRQMQTGQNPSTTLNRQTSPQPGPGSPVLPTLPSAPATGPQRDSLLQQSAKQAQVTIASNKLEIKADNSALSQILHDISGSTGMKVDGLSRDERIFGNYGPGDARDVLLALLEGSGYNVVMVGDLTAGAPRELNLTQRGTSVAAGSGSAARHATEEEAEEDQDVQQSPQPEPQPVQPLQNNPPGQDAGQQQPRTPQEILQELQRMRQQQNQNQPPQPQNPP